MLVHSPPWTTVDDPWPERVQSVCAAWWHLQKQKCILKMICQTFPPNPCMWRKKPPAPCDVWYNYFVNLPPGCCMWITVQSSWSIEDNSNNTVTSWWAGTVAIDWLRALMWDRKKLYVFCMDDLNNELSYDGMKLNSLSFPSSPPPPFFVFGGLANLHAGFLCRSVPTYLPFMCCSPWLVFRQRQISVDESDY